MPVSSNLGGGDRDGSGRGKEKKEEAKVESGGGSDSNAKPFLVRQQSNHSKVRHFEKDLKNKPLQLHCYAVPKAVYAYIKPKMDPRVEAKGDDGLLRPCLGVLQTAARCWQKTRDTALENP